jgi:hypothetical protein
MVPSQTLVPRAAPSSTFVYPTTFDTSIGTNFTEGSCPVFFQSFLNDQQFINCYPMSFFLLNSESYVTIARHGIRSVEMVLNASCSVNYQNCSTIMSSYSSKLKQQENCLDDLNLGNSLVVQAYADFNAYQAVYDATCLKYDNAGQPSTTNTTLASGATYCYSHDLFDPSSAQDAYLYLMPLGVLYPNNTCPTCSRCSQQVMDIFYQYTGVTENPISYTYDSAAGQIQRNCSAGFIHDSAKPLKSPHTSGAHSTLLRTSSNLENVVSLLVMLFPFIFSILFIS